MTLDPRSTPWKRKEKQNGQRRHFSYLKESYKNTKKEISGDIISGDFTLVYWLFLTLSIDVKFAYVCCFVMKTKCVSIFDPDIEICEHVSGDSVALSADKCQDRISAGDTRL